MIMETKPSELMISTTAVAPLYLSISSPLLYISKPQREVSGRPSSCFEGRCSGV